MTQVIYIKVRERDLIGFLQFMREEGYHTDFICHAGIILRCETRIVNYKVFVTVEWEVK